MSDNPRGRGRGRGDRGDRRGERARGDLPYCPTDRGHRGGGRFRGGDRGRGDGVNFRGRGDFRGGRRGGRGGRGGGAHNSGQEIFRDGQDIPGPDANVAQVEEKMAKALATSNQMRSLAQPYPERPGYGSKGTKTVLYANCLPMQLVSKPIYRYHVNILGEGSKAAPAGKKARQIMRLLLEEHFFAHLNSIVSDYRSTVVACVKLPLAVSDSEKQTFDVRYKDEDDGEYPEDPRIYKVTCEQTGVLDLGDLSIYLASSDINATLSNKEELIQATNLIIGHRPKTDRQVINFGNKHFNLNPELIESFSLGGGIDAIRGFFVSARAAAARVVLNVQVKYAATYQAGSLMGLIDAFWQSDYRRNVFRLEKFLKRVRVQLTHIKRKSTTGKPRANQIKAITALAYSQDGREQPNPPRVKKTGAGPLDVEFFVEAEVTRAAPSEPRAEASLTKPKNRKKAPAAGPAPAGEYVTVAAYFKQKYNIDTNPAYPVINTGTRLSPRYLPVEVCIVERGQPHGSKIGPNQTASMLNFAVRGRKPGHNAQSIVTKGVGMLGLEDGENGKLASFGVKVGTELITVQARVLPPPTIQYAKKKEIRTGFGSWNMIDIAFSNPAKLKTWTYLAIEQGRPFWNKPEDLQNVLNKFSANLRKMGMDIPQASQGQRVILTGNRDEDAKQIDDAVCILQEKYKDLSLVLGVLPAKETTLYNTIKQICDVRRGVGNINVQNGKFAESNPQYFANVGLKVNLKFGGVNQSLRSSDLGLFGDGKTMLVGIDVTHPSPGSASNAPSVAAIVASVDSNLGQWPAKICIQSQERNEMVEELKDMMQSRLKLWAKHNKGEYPENIVVYRDGVSESQYPIVIDKELPLLKEACKAICPASAKGLPRLSIIIVGKRHNMRFYPTNAGDAERSLNPKPGTVVDRGISEVRNWDFYLQAHSALQGTARPAHYFTVWDEIFFPKHPGKAGSPNAADVLQDLTHKMCYMFGRATKAVSVCPPAYYADLVCTRARCYLADVFDPESSPGGSIATGGTKRTIDRAQAVVHPNIADTMFYI